MGSEDEVDFQYRKLEKVLHSTLVQALPRGRV